MIIDSFMASMISLTWILLLIIIIELILKGFALWYSARNNQVVWFIVILIFNTLGILPLIYLLFFRKNKNKRAKKVIVVEHRYRKRLPKKVIKRKVKKS